VADLGVSGPGEKHSKWAPSSGGGWVRAKRGNFFTVATSKPLKVCNRRTPDVTQVAYPKFEFHPTFQGFLKMCLLDASFVLEKIFF
jgi:hypothetical protein